MSIIPPPSRSHFNFREHVCDGVERPTEKKDKIDGIRISDNGIPILDVNVYSARSPLYLKFCIRFCPFCGEDLGKVGPLQKQGATSGG